jgi:hypothetical protein
VGACDIGEAGDCIHGLDGAFGEGCDRLGVRVDRLRMVAMAFSLPI